MSKFLKLIDKKRVEKQENDEKIDIVAWHEQKKGDKAVKSK